MFWPSNSEEHFPFDEPLLVGTPVSANSSTADGPDIQRKKTLVWVFGSG